MPQRLVVTWKHARDCSCRCAMHRGLPVYEQERCCTATSCHTARAKQAWWPRVTGTRTSARGIRVRTQRPFLCSRAAALSPDTQARAILWCVQARHYIDVLPRLLSSIENVQELLEDAEGLHLQGVLRAARCELWGCLNIPGRSSQDGLVCVCTLSAVEAVPSPSAPHTSSQMSRSFPPATTMPHGSKAVPASTALPPHLARSPH